MSPEDEWARCAPWIEAGLAHAGVHRLETARAEVFEGRSLLWPGRRAAAVTETVRDFHIWAAGGAMDELLEMERDAAAWARAKGFDRITLSGRKGWDRVLAARGYRLLPRTLVKEL